jgi:hypothetical protein
MGVALKKTSLYGVISFRQFRTALVCASVAILLVGFQNCGESFSVEALNQLSGSASPSNHPNSQIQAEARPAGFSQQAVP